MNHKAVPWLISFHHMRHDGTCTLSLSAHHLFQQISSRRRFFATSLSLLKNNSAFDVAIQGTAEKRYFAQYNHFLRSLQKITFVSCRRALSTCNSPWLHGGSYSPFRKSLRSSGDATVLISSTVSNHRLDLLSSCIYVHPQPTPRAQTQHHSGRQRPAHQSATKRPGDHKSGADIAGVLWHGYFRTG